MSSVHEPMIWQANWRAVLRSMKRALLSRHRETLVGHRYCLAYETRGRQEDEDYPLLADLARDAKTVFDVGANVGLTSLVMSAVLAEGGKVYAFEASESACLVIRENLLLNGLETRVEIVNAVVSESSGVVHRFNWNFVAGNASVAMDSPSGTQIPLNKASLALDDFVAQTRDPPNFVKIDVEGAERAVLSGMREVLQESRPIVLVEIHSWPEMSLQQNVSEILPVLHNADYGLFDVRDGHETTEAGKLRSSGTSLYSRFWALLVPQEKRELLGKFAAHKHTERVTVNR
jgi:FkbM family methyltransferase